MRRLLYGLKTIALWAGEKSFVVAYIPHNANVNSGEFRRKADVRNTTVQTPYLAGKGSGRAEDIGLVERGREIGAANHGTERRVGEGAGDRAADGIRRQLKNLRLYIYRIKGDVCIGMEGFVAGGLELAVEGNVGILVKAGVALKAWFGGSTAFDNGEIMVKEAETPFKGFAGMSML